MATIRADLGKSCVRFKSLDATPLDALGPIVAAVPMEAFIARYHSIHAATKAERRTATNRKATRKSVKRAGAPARKR